MIACFRKPTEGEAAKAMNCNQMLEVIQKEYPSLVKNRSTRIHLGMALKELGYESTHRGNMPFYKVAIKAA